MVQTANPTAMSRNHNVSALFGGLSEARVRRAARFEEKTSGGAAMVNLIQSGFLFNHERSLRAVDVTAQDLSGAKSVLLSVEKTGFGRLVSHDPVLAEGAVDRGVAHVSYKTRKAVVEQTRLPEMRDEFDTSSLSSMMVAVQDRAANNNRAVSATEHTIEGEESVLFSAPRFRAVVDSLAEEGADSKLVSLFKGAEHAALFSAQPSHGITAADIDAAVKPELRVILFSEFLRAAAANSNGAGGKDFLSGGSVGALPVSNLEGMNRRMSVWRKAFFADEAARASYEGPKGWSLDAA